MSTITADTIKHLREITSAGMMDCKKALEATAGNLEEAIDWLRKKGLANAAKKAGRVAAEGVVAVATAGTAGAMIELNSETDFVARNERFQALAAAIAQVALQHRCGDVEALKALPFPDTGRTVGDEVTAAIGTIGENMALRRAEFRAVSQGVVASYIHNAIVPGMGKIGILVAVESSAASDAAALGKQVAMHVAAARPEALTVAELSPESVARERAVFTEQAAASGKPAPVIEKMVEGRLRKFYEEAVLTEQVFVVDGKTKVADVVAEAAKAAGASMALTGFARFQLGEGVEKQTSDFAAEVAKAASA